MARPSASFAVPLAEFAAALLAEVELTPRARLIAEQIAPMFPGSAVVLYVIENQDAPAWTPKATNGEIALHESRIEFDHVTLSRLADVRLPLIVLGKDVPREENSHLNVRRTVASLGYRSEERRVGKECR